MKMKTKYIFILCVLTLIFLPILIFFNLVKKNIELHKPCDKESTFSSLFDAINNRNKVCGIYLYNQKIDYVSWELYRMPNLKALSYPNNSFKSFPNDLLKLEKLTYLDLTENDIGNIPPEINKLKNLRVLKLRHTGLSSLTEEIINLKNLEYLDLSGNNFFSEPEFLKNNNRNIAIDYTDNPFTNLPN